MELATNADGKAMSVEVSSLNPFYGVDHLDPSNIESAQLRVLRNNEILEVIMWSMLVPKTSYRDSRIMLPDSNYLLQASLTCKIFYDPAMNVLWETIDLWSPIIRLISVVTPFEIEQEDRPSTSLTITEPILEEHLHRMDSYVRRIRTFVVGVYEGVSPQIYMALAKLRNFRIFPALIKLCIDSFDFHSDDIPSLSLISSPTLSILDFDGISRHPVVFPLLHDISLGCPSIRKISLDGELDAINFKLLGCFPRLENLKILLSGDIIRNIPITELRALSKLPNLKVFKLFTDQSITFSMPEVSSPTVLSFDALEIFEITCSASSVLRMMQTMSLKFLRRASLYILSVEPTVENVAMGSCLQLLLQRHWDTLRDLRIVTNACSVRISSDVLKCLTDLPPQLQLLELDVEYVDKETMDLLATSKCHCTLQTLRIRSNQPPPDASSLQASHIASFISRFPALQTLSIPVNVDLNANHVQAMRNIIMNAQRQTHPLRRITLHTLAYRQNHESISPVNITVSTAYVFARYLNHYFPHLEYVNSGIGFEETMSTWCEWVTMLTKEVQEEVSSSI